MTQRPPKGQYIRFPLRRVLAAGLVLLLAVFAPGPSSAANIDKPTKAFSKLFVGFETLSPPVAVPPLGLRDMDGDIRKLDEFRGSYILLDFWATWCPPCLREIPSLVALQEKFRDKNLKVVYVSLDFPESGAQLRKKMEAIKLPPIDTFYANDPHMWQDWRVESVPVSMLLDPQGNILYRMQGDAEWVSAASLAFFENKLKN